MTILDKFYIGTSPAEGDLDLLGDILSYELAEPQWDFVPFSANKDTMSGTRIGLGYPTATWTFNHLSDSDVEALRAFCPDLSNVVWIRMPTNSVDGSGNRIWHTFQCVMLWPTESEDKQAGRTLGLTLNFRRMVVDE